MRADDTGLLFLPLAHALTKGNALFDIQTGITIGFATDIAHLAKELQLFRPTTMAAVPRIFEKVYNAASNTAHHERKGPIFDHAVAVAIRWSRERTNGRVWPWTAAEHLLFDRLVYRKVRHAFVVDCGCASAAAARWASGSLTSSQGSASPSMRATASPRPALRSHWPGQGRGSREPWAGRWQAHR